MNVWVAGFERGYVEPSGQWNVRDFQCACSCTHSGSPPDVLSGKLQNKKHEASLGPIWSLEAKSNWPTI